MGKGGRPKLADSERRTAGQLVVRLNERELEIVSQKASEAGVTPTEWARQTALGGTPRPKVIVPDINHKAWLELSKLAATLNGAVWRIPPGGEGSLWASFDGLRRKLEEFRDLLVGEGQS